MKLDSIFNDLVYGELSSHAVAMNGQIENKDKPRIIAHINTVLTELYSRFPLLTKELVVIQYSAITEYHLHSDYAVSNVESTKQIKYILDTDEDPFKDDLLRIESVFDETGDCLLINSDSACKVALTPAQDVMEIPNPVDTNALFVIYRAKHPLVTEDTVELLLPEQFRTALLAYVASRMYAGGSAQEHAMLSTTLYQKYELFCSQQELYGMVNKYETSFNKKPCLGGWV